MARSVEQAAGERVTALCAAISAVASLISFVPSLFIGMALNLITRLIASGPAGWALACALLVFIPPLFSVLLFALLGFDGAALMRVWAISFIAWGIHLTTAKKRP